MFLVLDNAHMERFYWAWNCIKLDFRKRLNPAGMGIESSQGWNQERLWVLQSTSSLNTLDFHLKFLWILNYRASCWGRKMLSNQSVKVVKQCNTMLSRSVVRGVQTWIPWWGLKYWFSYHTMWSRYIFPTLPCSPQHLNFVVTWESHLWLYLCPSSVTCFHKCACLIAHPPCCKCHVMSPCLTFMQWIWTVSQCRKVLICSDVEPKKPKLNPLYIKGGG